jgi:hypothetical protein
MTLWLLSTNAIAEPAPAPEKKEPPAALPAAPPAQPAPEQSPPAETDADGDPRSKDAKAACLDAFTVAQRLRDVGKLVAARKELMFCSLQQCPELLRNQCVPWLEEVTHSIPTIVVAATDTAGNDTLAVRVKVDEQLVANVLDGRPIMLDPGPRKLVFEHEGERPIEQSIVVRQGEHNRRVEVDFATFRPTWDAPAVDDDDTKPRGPVAVATPPKGIPLIVPIMFGVAGGAAVIGAVTGIYSLIRADELEQECASAAGCSQDDIDSGKALAHSSTVSFSIAGAAAVVAVVALVVSWPSSERAALSPLLGPGFAGVNARF